MLRVATIILIGLTIFPTLGHSQQNEPVSHGFGINPNFGTQIFIFEQLTYDELRNNFNFHTGVTVGSYFRHSELEVGLLLYTRNYFQEIDNTLINLEGKNYREYCFVIPFRYYLSVWNIKKHNISAFSGINLVKPFHFSSNKVFLDNTETGFSSKSLKLSVQLSLHAGVRYSMQLNKLLRLVIAPGFDYRLIVGYNSLNYTEKWFDLPYNRFSIFLTTGLEFIINRRNLEFYQTKRGVHE